MNLKLTEDTFRCGVPLVLLLIAAIALGIAYAVELVYELKPCTLCLYQRVPFAVLGLLGIAAYIFNSDKSLMLLACGAGLVLLISAGLASYHIGVEQHWWTSVASCGVDSEGQVLTMSQFQALIRQKPEIACDEIIWSLFGFSMATYNAFVSLILGIIALWAANRLRTP